MRIHFFAFLIILSLVGCDGWQADVGKLVRKWNNQRTIDGNDIEKCIPDDGEQCTIQAGWNSTRESTSSRSKVSQSTVYLPYKYNYSNRTLFHFLK